MRNDLKVRGIKLNIHHHLGDDFSGKQRKWSGYSLNLCVQNRDS